MGSWSFYKSNERNLENFSWDWTLASECGEVSLPTYFTCVYISTCEDRIFNLLIGCEQSWQAQTLLVWGCASISNLLQERPQLQQCDDNKGMSVYAKIRMVREFKQTWNWRQFHACHRCKWLDRSWNDLAEILHCILQFVNAAATEYNGWECTSTVI